MILHTLYLRLAMVLGPCLDAGQLLLMPLPNSVQKTSRILARRFANYPVPRTNSLHAPSHYIHLAPRILPLPSQ